VGSTRAAAYRSALTAPDPWAQLRSTAVHVRSAQEVLAELRRRRAAPRFADADAVRIELVAPLAAALDADADAATSVARLGLRVAFVLVEPDAGFVIDARGERARVESSGRATPETPEPGAPSLTLTLTAEAAERLLAGRLDVARALRSGELRSNRSAGRTLAAASVLTRLPRLSARPRNHGGSRT